MKYNELKYLLELTDKEKLKADELCSKRIYTDFGPIFKEQRTIIKLQDTQIKDIIPPEEIIDYLDSLGYVITDYRMGKCVKKGVTGESPEESDRRLKHEIKIGGMIKSVEMKKTFDQRLSESTLKNNSRILIISHHPYDIAGMSTDKDWTSCMNVRDGFAKETPWRQIEYGGMVCYLMNESDWTRDNDDINKALARIAIKRLISDNSAFMFHLENKIYGLNTLAEEVNMDDILEAKLEESNKITTKNEDYFKTADDKSYTDSNIKKYRKYRIREEFKTFTEYANYIAVEFKFVITKIYEQEEMIDADGDVDLSHRNLKILPIQFNQVNGNFYCGYNNLTSLKGCPTTVNGNFYCYNNQLTSLEGCPKYVGGNFYCQDNRLTSLEGCPTTVNGNFYCGNNKLTSLEGCPEFIKGNWAIDNKFKSYPEYQSYLKNEGYTNK